MFRLRTATGLPDAQRKMIVQLAGDYFVSRLLDKFQLVYLKFSQFCD